MAQLPHAIPNVLTFDLLRFLRRPQTSEPRRVNVIGHRFVFGRGDVRIMDRVHFTDAARTWFDLAAGLSLRDLAVAGAYRV